MSEATFEGSTRYGSKLFVYIFVMSIIGTAGMVLGWLLASPELLTWASDGRSATDLVPVIGGGIIWVLGLGVLVTGTLALWHKLITDAVAAGVGAVADTHEMGEKAPSDQSVTENKRPVAERSMAGPEEESDAEQEWYSPSASTDGGEKPGSSVDATSGTEDGTNESSKR